jgi:DNA invertase Pin-like site-specific DNA recombinase
MEEDLEHRYSASVGEVFGYIRVSPGSLSMRLQFDELRAINCDHVPYFETATRTGPRPVLRELLATLQPGDVVLVARLHMLGRSMHELIDTVETLARRDVTIRSLHEGLDTGTESGRAFVRHISLLKEFEQDLVHDNAASGFVAARKAGRVGGRPRKITADQERMVILMRAGGDLSVTQIAVALGLGRSTVYRAINRARM